MSWSKDADAVFTINGTIHRVSGGNSIGKSLNTYLRNDLGLTGTKVMCREGSCGSCVVSLSLTDPSTGQQRTLAVNSCLLPVLACHGKSVTTVEGIGSRATGYNKVQSTLAHFNGTQCGFCSPGFVMTMYSLLQSNPKATAQEVEDSFSGNLCRCTGYRPILDAFKSLSSNPPTSLLRRLLDIEECLKGSTDGGRNKCCTFKSDNSDLTLEFTELSLCEERFHLKGFNKEWYRVASVREIFQVLDMIGNKKYFLVAGNTSLGIQVRETSAEPQVYIDISSVKELKIVQETPSSWTVGAATTLSDLIARAQQLAARGAGFAYTAQIALHLQQVANVPVRNRATVGGNLYFARYHGDFPSDVFLLLDAVSANINIERRSGVKESVPATTFRTLDLNKTIIRSVTLKPAGSTQRLISYKVMQAAQSIVASVNGAFFYDVNSGGVVTNATVVLSGINHTFRRAVKTEAYLKGKNIYSQKVLRESLKVLFSEVVPDEDPLSFSPAYRKQLALSLFYKSVLSVVGDRSAGRYRSGSTVLLLGRPLSSGKQVYYTDQQEWPLTQPIPKIEALIQCAGEAVYTKDMSRPGVLYAKFVQADRIGTIVNIDGSKALAMCGVKGFYTAKDIPGENNVLFPFDLAEIKPLELFCSGNVLYWGQPVGLIVASDEETAWNAAQLVKITYKDVRTHLLTDIKQVLMSQESKSRVTLRNSFKSTKTGGSAQYKFNGELTIGGQYNHSMETQSCLVSPLEDGQFHVNCAAQSMAYVAAAISRVLAVPINKLDLEMRRVGGAFGSKVESHLLVSAAAALGAFKLGKPVKMSSPLPEDMLAVGKRAAFYAKYQGAVDNKGIMQYLDIKVYYDMGCQITPMYFSIFGAIPVQIKSYFNWSTWNFECYTVTTDKPPASITRAPLFNSVFNLIEQIMDRAAFESNNDPVQVRLNNSNDPTLSKYISNWRQSTEYDKRREAIIKYNQANRWKKRGISLCAMKYFAPVFYRGIGCSVTILWPDASVQVMHGGVEMGQGINTKVAQVVAHVLGVDLSTVQVKACSSHVTANNQPSQATVTSDLATYAALKCCQELNSRIDPVRKSLRDPNDWRELVDKLYNNSIDMNVTHSMGLGKEGSELQDYYVCGVCVADVEVDVLTGERQIGRVDLLEDVGRSMSPEVDVGQVEGAFIMGVGLNTSERLVFDPQTGQLFNNRLWSYKIPTSKDIPADFRVTFIPNTSNPTGVFGSKGTGEPALVLAVGVVNSFRNALMDARSDAGLSKAWLHLDSPLTIETLFNASGSSLEQYTF